MKRFLILSAAVLLMNFYPVDYISVRDNFKIGFTGDILMHNNIKKTAGILSRKEENNYGYDYFFDEISNELSYADVMCGNMEFPVSPPFKSDGFIFNAPPHIAAALKTAGFDIMNLANNHITDQKTKGLLYTVNLLESVELDYIGAAQTEETARKGIIKEKNGIRTGFLAYTGLTNYSDRLKSDKYYINWIYDKEKVEQDITDMKQRCDYLVIQIHNGVEYTLTPAAWKVKLYHEIAEMGADLIIGHHPHSIQSAENFLTADSRQVPIFYSLGNFISDQKQSFPIKGTRETVSIKSTFIVYVHLFKKWSQLQSRLEILPVYTENYPDEFKKRPFRNIKVKPIAAEIYNLENQLNSDSPADPKLSVKLTRLKSELNAIKMVVFPEGIPDNMIFTEQYSGD
ncbi:MAG: CapA family protein [Spirochaetes bacterium]|nr:CapA family protein [Spirochaetota bacterium]